MIDTVYERKLAEGILYGYHLERRASSKQVTALLKLRDVAREAGLILKANDYGQIEVREVSSLPGSEGNKIATCMFI